QLPEIIMGLGELITNPVVVVAVFFGVILYMLFIKVLEHFRDRMQQNDENMQQFSETLREVSNQMERISVVTEKQSEDIEDLRTDIRELRQTKKNRN
ncbi:MAG: hypothetical protein ACOC1K_03190, partial [Nanoarchaeota archaeon]